MDTVDFMKRFSKLSVDNKLNTIKKMNEGPPATATPQQIKTFEALKKWCGMSVVVGEDLCPPTIAHLETYL